MDPARKNSSKDALAPKERPFPTGSVGAELIEPGLRNCIARDTRITGDLKSTLDVLVDGEVNGDVHTTGNVFQSKWGALRGNVQCKRGHFLGIHEGSIKAIQDVRLGVQASVVSSIETSLLIIESGASFSGSLKLINELKADKLKNQ